VVRRTVREGRSLGAGAQTVIVDRAMKPKIEQKPTTIGRSYLISKLRNSGFSRRQSVEVVNAILEAMIEALRRGEDVEFPLGRLRRIHRYFNKKWEWADDWPADQDPYTVVYQLDEAGEQRVLKEILAATGRGSKSGK
jgi:hypothetical protein